MNEPFPGVNRRAAQGAGPPLRSPGMATKDLSCPICNADLPLNGDERKGDEIFCTYCGAPCRLVVKPKKQDDKEDEYTAEEDY